MLKLLASLFGALTLLFVSSSAASAAFTIGSTPDTIDENGTFSVTVNLSGSAFAGRTYYLRAAFAEPGTSNYFGYTQNNASNWYNGTPSPLDYTQFYRITVDSTGNWTGQISVKPDTSDPDYQGTRNYDFKVGRYTEAGSLTWSDPPFPQIGITKQQTFQLAMGWNLVGLAVDKEATSSAEAFLQDLNATFIPINIPNKTPPSGNKVLSVTRFDPNLGRYVTHLLGSSDNNFTVAIGEGYFIRANWPGTATIAGLTPTISSISIAKGLSMISFPRALTGISNAEQLLQAMQAQGVDARLIVRWFAGRWLPHDLGSSANIFPITPGEGYFIRNFGTAGTFTLP